MENIYFQALGCRLNEAELEQWQRLAPDHGYQLTGDVAAADVIVVNTCAVTGEAARKSRKLANRLHRQSGSLGTRPAMLVVTGCLASIDPKSILENTGADMVLPNMDKDRLFERLAMQRSLPADPRELAIEKPLTTQHESKNATAAQEVAPSIRTRAFIKVQDGCRNRCSFCIVTVARGEERSLAVGDVIDEINQRAAEGIQEVVLSGVHLGGYGSDIGTDLKSLMQSVLAHTDVPRIRLSSLEPWDLPDDFFSLWDNPRLCPHLHLPIQSGSDRILKRMARRSLRDDFLSLVRQARERIPNLCISTDIIVGFPGEDESDFDQSLSLCDEARFHHAHIFSYSRREGTAAGRMSGQVDSAVKKDRSKRLHAHVNTIANAVLSEFIGTTQRVLWEKQVSKTNPNASDSVDGEVQWTGLSENYLRCVINTPKDASTTLANTVTPVMMQHHERSIFSVKPY